MGYEGDSPAGACPDAPANHSGNTEKRRTIDRGSAALANRLPHPSACNLLVRPAGTSRTAPHNQHDLRFRHHAAARKKRALSNACRAAKLKFLPYEKHFSPKM